MTSRLAMGCAVCVLTTVSCSRAADEERERVISVPEVVANIDKFNDQTMTVSGYLGECFGYDCVLYVDEASHKEAELWRKRSLPALRRGERLVEYLDADSRTLGVGSGEWVCPDGPEQPCFSPFDREAEDYWNSYVLITGKVTNRCRYQGKMACTDRTTDLEPTGIEAWRKPAGAAEIPARSGQ